MLNEKIKSLRKANNLTQEELADKISVSRQAITKWETGLGTPDISNLEALARLFGISIDELLSDASPLPQENVSRTEFDIFGKSDFHLSTGVAKSLDVCTADIEKVIVEVRSDLPVNHFKLAKVKLTEGKRVDLVVVQYKSDKRTLDVLPDKSLSKQDAKNHLFIKMILPNELANHIEIEGNLMELNLHDIATEHHIEFDGKLARANVSNVKGHFELTSNIDMEVKYDGSMKQFDINQLHSIANLYLPKDTPVDVYNKGRACRVLFQDYDNKSESENKVEYNGYKSELTVHAE